MTGNGPLPAAEDEGNLLVLGGLLVDRPIFADVLETGDTGEWTLVEPASAPRRRGSHRVGRHRKGFPGARSSAAAGFERRPPVRSPPGR